MSYSKLTPTMAGANAHKVLILMEDFWSPRFGVWPQGMVKIVIFLPLPPHK